MLIGGGLLVLAGIAILFAVTVYWSAQGFVQLRSVFPAVAGTSLMTIGVQNMLGGFLLAIVCGNDAKLLKQTSAAREPDAPAETRKPRAKAA
jgi:hypothetical protein